MKFVTRHAIPLALIAIFAGCSTEPAKEATTTDGSQTAYRRADSQSSPRGVAGAATQALARPSERSIYYEYDKSDIRPESRALLESNARYLRENPGVSVRVEGNADERGSAEYNLALGQRRAEAVTRQLKVLGVSESRIEAVSLGKEKPKRAGHDESSWAENRRSDIVY